MMFRRIAITAVMAIVLSSCGGRQVTGLGVFPGSESVRVQPWLADPNTPPPPLWPVGTRRVQVAITPYEADCGTGSLVWIVSNGRRLLAVYFVPKEQQAQIFPRIGQQGSPAMEVLQLRSRGPHKCTAKHADLCPTCGVSPARRAPE